MEVITDVLSSLVSWLQEAPNPSRRADMLRTLTVSSLLRVSSGMVVSMANLLGTGFGAAVQHVRILLHLS